MISLAMAWVWRKAIETEGAEGIAEKFEPIYFGITGLIDLVIVYIVLGIS